MKKRFCYTLFLLCLILSLVTVPVSAASSVSDISSRLNQISQTSEFTVGYRNKARACWVFANKVSAKLFGVSIPSSPTGYYLDGINENPNWYLVAQTHGSSATNSAVKEILKQAQAGDIIQYVNSKTTQHTAMVYATNSNGISIYDSTKPFGNADYQVVRLYTCSWDEIFSWTWEAGLGEFGNQSHGLSLYRCNKNVKPGDNPPPPKGDIIIKVISADVKTTGADTITETSAILRGSFTTTGERATECGMYLGADQNNLTKLGSDSVNTFGTSMFYSTAKYGRTLNPGTTYYYQAYVSVGGTEYRGSVESFSAKGTPPTPTPALGVSLSSDSLTLEYGTSNKLTASTTPAGLPVTWKSSDESVVTVKDGVVTAIGSGTAHVVAIVYGDKKSASDFCTVTVQDQPDSIKPAPVDPDIKLAQSTVTLNIGERTSLRAITTPEGQPVRWNSSNETAATVDPNNGTVTAVGIGTATITAYMEYDGSTYFTLCSVTVKRTTPDVSISVSGVTNIAQTTARVNASCAYGSGSRPTSVGLYLGTSPSSLSYWSSDSGITHNMNPFNIWYNLSGLSAGTTYYYQFYAVTDSGEVRSEVNSFTTEAPAPVSNTRTAVVVNTNGQYLAINDRPAASPRNSNQIGRIPPAGTVTVYPDKTSGNWYYVEYNGVSGYAYSKYLSLQ